MRTHKQVLQKRQVFSDILTEKTDMLLEIIEEKNIPESVNVDMIKTQIDDCRSKIRVLDWVLGIEND